MQKFFLDLEELRRLSDEELLRSFFPKGAGYLLACRDNSVRRVLEEPLAPYTAGYRKLRAAHELVRRALMEDLRSRRLCSSPSEVQAFLVSHFSGCFEERFVALWLDSQNRLLSAEELFRGTLTQTSVYPREVVRHAIAHNAAAVIFAHNHPSGLPEPSRADELLTRSLKEVLGFIDVRVLDHVIVAGTFCVSFAERGLM